MMAKLRIVVNEYYLYENNLVKVVGAAGMDNADTMRFLIQWGDSQGRACSAEVTRRELSAAPSMERLYHDYRMALDAICNQANRIEELEAALMPDSDASITTPEGQRDYYRDLMTFERDENIRLTRELAEYEAYEERAIRESKMAVKP